MPLGADDPLHSSFKFSSGNGATVLLCFSKPVIEGGVEACFGLPVVANGGFQKAGRASDGAAWLFCKGSEGSGDSFWKGGDRGLELGVVQVHLECLCLLQEGRQLRVLSVEF